MFFYGACVSTDVVVCRREAIGAGEEAEGTIRLAAEFHRDADLACIHFAR